mgnify:CR=1 FL=1|jgi:hypothetical protein
MVSFATGVFEHSGQTQYCYNVANRIFISGNIGICAVVPWAWAR